MYMYIQTTSERSHKYLSLYYRHITNKKKTNNQSDRRACSGKLASDAIARWVAHAVLVVPRSRSVTLIQNADYICAARQYTNQIRGGSLDSICISFLGKVKREFRNDRKTWSRYRRSSRRIDRAQTKTAQRARSHLGLCSCVSGIRVWFGWYRRRDWARWKCFWC